MNVDNVPSHEIHFKSKGEEVAEESWNGVSSSRKTATTTTQSSVRIESRLSTKIPLKSFPQNCKVMRELALENKRESLLKNFIKEEMVCVLFSNFTENNHELWKVFMKAAALCCRGIIAKKGELLLHRSLLKFFPTSKEGSSSSSNRQKSTTFKRAFSLS